MAPLSSRKNLSCFYCGNRSNFRFQGQQSFVCTYCDATNWLDERGDITDPPASTSSIQQGPVQYAVPRVSRAAQLSPPPSQDAEALEDSIFCATCRKNQRMVTESIRQYEFPDDPDAPEYAARERTYRKWKRDIEDRYPQICVSCEPKVQEKLQKASYAAKTDHLKRMMDRTRTRRQEVKQLGLLDMVDAAGRWSWHIAFALQLMWHVTVLCALLVKQDVQDENDSPLLRAMRGTLAMGVGMLHSPDRVMRWATNLSMCSFPWNPRFKQTIRGFTSHILGFRQWYTYQLVILFIRFVCLFISQYNELNGMPATTQLGAHLVIACLMYYLHKVAGKSVRTDTTPLFGYHQSFQPPQRTPQKLERERDPNDLGNILDDIMQSSPTRNASPQTCPISGSSPSHPPRTSSPLHNGSYALPQRPQPELSFGSLNLSESHVYRQPETQVPQYEDEMDWTPSGSHHRAFSTHNPFKVKNPNPRFNDAPIEAKPGPFWYKVPPAPTNPAQRLRNPTRPVIRESPKEKKPNFFRIDARGPVDLGSGAQHDESGFKLQNPKFYAPNTTNDPRDGLSRMMGSFSISPSPEEQEARLRNGVRGFGSSLPSTKLQNDSKIRMAELIALFSALWAWVNALGTTETYGKTMALGAICAGLIISIRLTADLLVDAQNKEGRQPSVFSLSWANLGMLQVVASLVLLWGVWSGSGSGSGIIYGLQGNILFGVEIAHQVWHVFA